MANTMANTNGDKLSNQIDEYIQMISIQQTPIEKFGKMDLDKLGQFKLKGKQLGKTFENVFMNEKKYVEWVLRNGSKISQKSSLGLFRHYVMRILLTKKPDLKI